MRYWSKELNKEHGADWSLTFERKPAQRKNTWNKMYLPFRLKVKAMVLLSIIYKNINLQKLRVGSLGKRTDYMYNDIGKGTWL